MSARDKIAGAWNGIEDSIEGAKQKAAGPMQDKLDKHVGIYLFHNIATVFIFDEEVQARVYGGRICPRCGNVTREKKGRCHSCSKEFRGDEEYFKGVVEHARSDEMSEAKMKGAAVQDHVMRMAERDRVYQSKVKQLTSKMEDIQGSVEDRVESSSLKGFLKQVKRYNRKAKDRE